MEEEYINNKYYRSGRICAQVHLALQLLADNIRCKRVGYRLPPCAKRFKNDKVFLGKLEQCCLRIMERLSLGRSISPNCTGEEICIHLIRGSCEDGSFLEFVEFISPEPEDGDNWGRFFNCELQDMDAVMLFQGL